MRTARFEVVRSDAPQPWHARFVAANGQVVWTSETYRQKGSAVRAIDTLARFFSPTGQAWTSNVWIGSMHSVDLRYGSEGHRLWSNAHKVEVRTVDERTS